MNPLLIAVLAAYLVFLVLMSIPALADAIYIGQRVEMRKIMPALIDRASYWVILSLLWGLWVYLTLATAF